MSLDTTSSLVHIHKELKVLESYHILHGSRIVGFSSQDTYNILNELLDVVNVILHDYSISKWQVFLNTLEIQFSMFYIEIFVIVMCAMCCYVGLSEYICLLLCRCCVFKFHLLTHMSSWGQI